MSNDPITIEELNAIFGMHVSEQTMFATLAAAKGAVRLESVGMKSRRGSARVHWAGNFGMKKSASHEQVRERLQEAMDLLMERAKGGVS